MTEVLVVFVIFVLFPGVILSFILLSRYMKYRETLAMLEHGITPPPPPPVMVPPMQAMYPMARRPPVMVPQAQRGAGRATLIWGLVLSGIGLALTLALWPIGFIANSASGNTVNFPLGLGPWMLVGFTPLFIGLALILGFVIMRPERSPHPSPADTAQGTPGTPPAQASFMPTEAVGHQETAESAPPGSPLS